MSDELFYMESGVKKDENLHKTILDNPEAENYADRVAVEQAVRRGVLRKDAEDLFLRRKVVKKTFD
jgi:hypothetical protein